MTKRPHRCWWTSCRASPTTLPMAQDPTSAQPRAISPRASDAIGVPASSSDSFMDFRSTLQPCLQPCLWPCLLLFPDGHPGWILCLDHHSPSLGLLMELATSTRLCPSCLSPMEKHPPVRAPPALGWLSAPRSLSHKENGATKHEIPYVWVHLQHT